MTDLKDNSVLTSEAEALSYWNTEFGLPEYYSSHTEIFDAETKLGELMLEKQKLEREIANRNVESVNNYTINRLIELHFLVEMGNKYIEKCTIVIDGVEDDLKSDLSRDFNDDNLFTKNYEED